MDRHTCGSCAWGGLPPSVLEASYPLVHSFIKNSIEYELTRDGPIEDAKNPDLCVTYCANPKEWVRVLVRAYG